MSRLRLIVSLSVAALVAATAVQAEAKKAAHKKPPAEKCTPYGEDLSMCGYTRK